MKTNLIAISTYLKNGALTDLLNSLMKFKYDQTCDILICDDGEGHARDTWIEFNNRLPRLLYTTGENQGIAINKNRGIRFFLEQKQYQNLILIDDDIIMKSGYIFEACINTGLGHVTGFLGENDYQKFSDTGNPFFKSFPVIAQTDTGVIFCGGAQGVMLFLTREMAEKALFFHVPPGRYGFEHSIYSNVCNTLIGYNLDYFPLLERSSKYFEGNYNWPNNYDAAPSIPINQKWWMNKKVDIWNKVNYINKNSQVPDGEEVLRIDRPRI